MPTDPESFLGVGPESSGSPAESPVFPESLEARLTRRSLKAFVLGVFVIVVGWAVFVVMWGHWFSIFIVNVGVASSTVSLVCGLRVVGSRRYVLSWVIPSGLIVTLFTVAFAFVVDRGSPPELGVMTAGILIVGVLGIWASKCRPT